MKHVAVRCDDAGARGELGPTDVWEELTLQSRGPSGELNIRVPSLPDRLRGAIPDVALDLTRIAAYAYWADQMVSRPAETDVAGRRWPRSFAMFVSVAAFETWTRTDVKAALQDVLEYGSGDLWDFQFESGHPPGQGYLFGADRTVIGDPECVVLFSGGLDSLCSAVEEEVSGRRPLLVSHAPSNRAEGLQRRLAKELDERTSSWHFPRCDVHISKSAVREKESTQRTRGFLYSAIGASVAAGFGITDVVVADNGWVSVGLPVSGQAIGTKMSRTTHPRFQYLFNRLLSLVLPEIRVRNPLLFRTRSDCLNVLVQQGKAEMIGLTQSCAASSRLPADTSHCGVCSQCLDRQVAVRDRGLQTHDVTYVQDAFLGELKDDALMLAESYVRLMRVLVDCTPEDAFVRFPEIADCATRDATGSPEAVEAIVEMLIRQAGVINGVLVEAGKPVLARLMTGEYSTNSLVRLALAGRPVKKASGAQKLGAWVPTLTPDEEAEFQSANLKSRLPIVLTGERVPRNSNLLEVAGRRVTLADAEFVLFLRLFVELTRSQRGWCRKGGGRTRGGLVDEILGNDQRLVPDDVGNAISRLRKGLQLATGEIDPTDLIESDGHGFVRLSTHPRYISVDLTLLKKHPDSRVRDLALQVPVVPDSIQGLRIS